MHIIEPKQRNKLFYQYCLHLETAVATYVDPVCEAFLYPGMITWFIIELAGTVYCLMHSVFGFLIETVESYYYKQQTVKHFRNQVLKLCPCFLSHKANALYF